MQDYKDGSGLQLINFDFWQAFKNSKFPFWWNVKFLSRYFVFFISYFFAFSTFGDFFVLFQDNKPSLKQAPSHNHHKNT